MVNTAERIIKPTRERRKHDRVMREVGQIADSAGEIGNPFRAEGMLGRMERRGDIDGRMRQAGEKFQELFWKAHLDPLKAADMGRVAIAGMMGAGLNHGTERARNQISEAMQVLGGMASPAGSCAWFVLGCDYSIAQFAARMNWRGEQIGPEVAKGILLGVLAVLAVFFGL